MLCSHHTSNRQAVLLDLSSRGPTLTTVCLWWVYITEEVACISTPEGLARLPPIHRTCTSRCCAQRWRENSFYLTPLGCSCDPSLFSVRASRKISHSSDVLFYLQSHKITLAGLKVLLEQVNEQDIFQIFSSWEGAGRAYLHVQRLSDLDPKDSTVHSRVLPNPECLPVCLTLNPLSRALFQVEALFI